VQQAVGLPVLDVLDLLKGFYAGLGNVKAPAY
jgi:hypothetical protein